MTARSSSGALTWEYWRRGMLWFVAANITLVAFFTTCLYSTLLNRLWRLGISYYDLRAELDRGLVAIVIWPPVVIAMANWKTLQGNYARPVSTRKLVFVSIANGAAACALMYAVLALVMRAFYGAHWLFLGPLICVIAYYVFLQAVVWCGGSSTLIAMVALGLAVWAGAAAMADSLWASVTPGREPGWPDLAFWGLAIAATGLSFLLATYAVARDRRGESLGLTLTRSIWSLMRRRTLPSAKAAATPVRLTRRFGSRHAAQHWAEWQAKGRWPVWSAMAVTLVMLLVLMQRQSTVFEAEQTIALIIATAFLLMPLIGLALGTDGGRFDRKSFSSTLPLSDSELANAVLYNVARVVFTSAIVGLVGATAISWYLQTPGWLRVQGEWNESLANFIHQELGAAVFLLVAWTVCAWTATLALARPWLVGSVFCGSLLTAALVLRFASLLGFAEGEWIVYPVALFGLAAFVYFFLHAGRRRLIGTRTVVCSLAGWYCLSVAVGLAALPTLTLEEMFLATCFATFPFTPFAAAPLALSWNRHR